MNRIVIKESEINEIVKNVLKEELGSFENQYQIAKYIADEAIKMFNEGVFSKNIKIDGSKDISSVDLSIINGYSIYQLIGFNNEENKLIVQIGSKNLNDNNLPNAIAHELMHGNIYLNRLHSNPSFNFNDAPSYYEDIMNIIDMQNGDIAYYFCYALYSTYYQETNAFVSQVSGEIIDNVKNPISNKEFKKIYARTNSVETFHTNIKYAEYILNSGNNTIQKYVIDKIKINELNNVKSIKNACKKIIDVSQKALKDCSRNAMIAFKYLKENNLITEN